MLVYFRSLIAAAGVHRQNGAPFFHIAFPFLCIYFYIIYIILAHTLAVLCKEGRGHVSRVTARHFSWRWTPASRTGALGSFQRYSSLLNVQYTTFAAVEHVEFLGHHSGRLLNSALGMLFFFSSEIHKNVFEEKKVMSNHLLYLVNALRLRSLSLIDKESM